MNDIAGMKREAAINHSRITRATLRQIDNETSILLTDADEFNHAVTDVFDAIRSNEFDRLVAGFAMLE